MSALFDHVSALFEKGHAGTLAEPWDDPRIPEIDEFRPGGDDIDVQTCVCCTQFSNCGQRSKAGSDYGHSGHACSPFRNPV